MKKIINGALYDTETATVIGRYDNGFYRNDFDFFEEILYRTKSGKFFLYGEGGGDSRYGEWHGNSGGPGKKIMTMTFAEAQKWAEINLDGDGYIAIFGEPDEGDKVFKGFYLSPAAIKKLELLRSDSGRSLSDIVESLILA